MSRKNRFHRAIVESLEALRREDKKITKTAVIENARFEDGTAVGKTTLYSRHAATGEFVHAELLRMIDEAVSGQKKSGGKKGRAEALAGLRRTIAGLREENAKLIDQVVEQEARLQSVSVDRHGDRHIISSQEDELFVLISIINRLTQNTVGDFVEQERRYTQKYRNDSKLRVVGEEIDGYIDEINRSKLFRLSARD